MAYVLSNVPESYKNIVENLEDELDQKYYSITIQRINDNLA